MTEDELLAALEGLGLSNNGKEAMQFKTLRTYKVDTLRRIYAAIKRCNNFIDISTLTGDKIPENIDIMTYSFPCQDLSNVGAFHGYNKGIDKGSGSRSSLLWQVGRILAEMKVDGKKLPKFLLLENVPALLAERHIGNFETWIKDLEALGYISKYFLLNARDFGLPQNRPRLLMISVYVGESETSKSKVQKYFDSKCSADIVSEYYNSKHYREIKVSDLLRINYADKKLLAEAIECTPNKTVSRDTIWKDNPQIIREDGTLDPQIKFIRTITTKQDRNPNSGNLYFNSGIPGRSTWRYLTPRECFLFMGFTDADYDHVIENNPEVHINSKLFPRDKLIRMAGNSIPVKLLEGIFYQIQKIDEQLSG
jgi:DNA (cytosine-5)-methyltransferase 1